MEYRFGKMEPDMKVIGKMIYFMVMEHIILIKVMFIKENFIMEKLMAMAHQHIMTGVYLRVNIKMGRNMVWDFILLLKEKSKWENGEKVKELNG